MKKLCYLIAIVILSACNKEKQQDMEISKTESVADTVSPSPDMPATEPDSIAFIRSKVTQINKADLQRKHFKFTCDELMKVDYFYRNDSIVKISVDFGTIGDTYAKEDYYYDRGELIFMYELVEGGPACEGCITKHEYRYYIRDHKTFLSLKDQQQQPCRKCEFPDSSRQYRLLNTSTAAEIKAAICR